MRTRNNILSYLFIVLLTASMAACTRDTVDDSYGIIPPGESVITAEVEFKPMGSGLNGTTRTQGDAIRVIKDLNVLLYDSEYKLVKCHYLTEGDAKGQYKIAEVERDNKDFGYEQGIAEEMTQRATFNLDVANGSYYIYAVANMGDLSERSEIETVDGLKSIQLKWDEKVVEKDEGDNVVEVNNDEMFGFFHDATTDATVPSDAQPITINGGKKRLHAWIRRAASKVTVAVDGEGLYDGVMVWIKSIQIKDIPSSCYLGKKNTASAHDLIEDGEKLTFGSTPATEPDVPNEDNMITNGEANKDKTVFPRGDVHSETAAALFFYENMQGQGQSKKQLWEGDKPSEEDNQFHPHFPDGNNPLDKGFKDSKVAGSYIEVIGYYKYDGTENKDAPVRQKSEGPIVYRFMLGKDTDTDYDAERNYHYKLTLKLKNYADDNDWHIVYNTEPKIIARDPYYISYVYDETVGYPIKIVGGELISLEARIPDGEKRYGYDDDPKDVLVSQNSWHAYVPDNDKSQPYYPGSIEGAGPWNGFLSLRKTTKAVLAAATDTDENGTKYDGDNPKTYTFNKEYYYDNNRGYRKYDVNVGPHPDSKDGDYTIAHNGAGEWTATIPLYTRARVMAAQTAYTGNNPYVAYRRKANVAITATIKPYGSNSIIKKDTTITIYQMRRVVNPKAIWRSASCTDDFHVKMMIMESETATEFKPLVSDGPWRAEIEVSDGDWFDLIPTDGASQKNPDGTISGTGNPYDKENEAGRIIDFTFHPKGAASSPRGGIIKIYYNNYSCVHRIFVRQGYEPVRLYSNDPKWHCFNLLTTDKEVSDPVLEGSYFKCYNREQPIAASNNNSAWIYNGNDRKFTVKDGSGRDFIIEGSTTTKKWKDITTEKKEWGKFMIDNRECRIASIADFKVLIDNDNTIYGYGVLYTDGSIETATKIADVYEAREGNHKGKGMRGVVLCNSESGMNIFLPIGATGYGRFKQKNNVNINIYNRLPANYEGVIQYANRYAEFPVTGTKETSVWQERAIKYGVEWKPLFWDIYRREGAVYWLANIEKSGEKEEKQISNDALDINYYTFDFSPTTASSAGLVWTKYQDPSGTDAVQIRLVED